MAPQEKTITLTMPLELWQVAQRAAEKRTLSLAAYLRQLILGAVQQEKTTHEH